MKSETPNIPQGLSTTQIQITLRKPLLATVENEANLVSPPQYASQNLPTTAYSEPFTERPSTWGSISCGGMGGLGGAGAGYATFGFPWGLLGAAVCLPAMIFGFCLFKGFDATAEDARKTPCVGFEPRQHKPG